MPHTLEKSGGLVLLRRPVVEPLRHLWRRDGVHRPMEDQDGSVELVQHLRNIRGRVQQLPGGGEARLTVVDSRVPDHHLALVVKLEGLFGDDGGGRDLQASEKNSHSWARYAVQQVDH